jgi:cytochrome P450
MVQYDPYAYEIHEDPYPTYAELRAKAPVFRHEDKGFFALSRHADVLNAFKDIQRYSNGYGVSIDPSAWTPNAASFFSFLALDPPDHTKMRSLVSRGFTPRRVAALEPRIQEMTKEYLEPLRGSDGFDFIEELAGKVPMDVISELLGVPKADRAELRRRADLLVHREDGATDVSPEGIEAFAWMHAYFTDMLNERRKKSTDDLLSALLEVEVEGERLNASDILAFAVLMIVAGNETTTKLLANSIFWLARNPEERAKVNADPSLVPAWIEETLRYDNSTQMLARRATEKFTLHGVEIPEGGQILLLVGSANRDERVFERAERYDIRRDTSESLSFGQGSHFCLGASLARLEARVVLAEWQRHFANYEINEAGAVRVHSINVRGFANLPVTS